MPKLCRACAGFFIGSSPSSDNSPLVGGNSVVSILIVVVFPAPFGPKNANTSPFCTSNDTLSTAVNSPNFFTSFSTRITVPLPESPRAFPTSTQASPTSAQAFPTSAQAFPTSPRSPAPSRPVTARPYSSGLSFRRDTRPFSLVCQFVRDSLSMSPTPPPLLFFSSFPSFFLSFPPFSFSLLCFLFSLLRAFAPARLHFGGPRREKFFSPSSRVIIPSPP